MKKKLFILAILTAFIFQVNLIQGIEWNVSLEDGLFAYYNCTDAKDQVSGYDLTARGTLLFQNGIFEDGCDSLATDSSLQIDIGTNDAFKMQHKDGNFTINMWINSNDAGSGGDFISTRDSSVNTTHGFRLVQTNGDIFNVLGLGAETGSTQTIPNGAWYMLTITKNTTHNCMWFNYTDEVTCWATASVNDSGATYMNVTADVGSGGVWQGIIDEFAFWNRTLSPAEIGSLWNNSDGISRDNRDTTNPSLTINTPISKVYEGLSITLNATATDNVNASSCAYNITIGGTTEIAHTYVNCSNFNATETLTLYGSYTAHFIVFDNIGNANYSSITFGTSASGGGGVSSGGGGGGVLKIIESEEDIDYTSICPPYKEVFRREWEANAEFGMLERITSTWNSWWNFALCESASSIVPI